MSTIEHEDDTIRIRYLDGHRTGPRFPRELDGNEAFRRVPGRRILSAVFHHTAGGFYEGIRAVDRIIDFCIAPPKFKRDEDGHIIYRNGRPILIGGGRGWPGCPYTYVIPAYPSVEDGRLVLFKVWHDDWITWHTGGAYNEHGVGAVIGGWYQSRHDLLSGEGPNQALARPTEEAMTCADRLADYLMDRHRLKMGPDTLKSHAELGKPACPGGFLENWVRVKRGDGEIVDPLPGLESQRELKTVRQIQEALVELGYSPGDIDGLWGPFTANALRAFQREESLRPDGIFGPISRQAMRLALARREPPPE